ncbi:MAG: hypothetical protein ACT6RN_27800 [Agrobacterium sp.]|uniref:hypothetical protein n=1 Tax=Agrobacterium sp. TaxID=361 RepID=UPI0040383AB2
MKEERENGVRDEKNRLFPPPEDLLQKKITRVQHHLLASPLPTTKEGAEERLEEIKNLKKLGIPGASSNNMKKLVETLKKIAATVPAADRTTKRRFNTGFPFPFTVLHIGGSSAIPAATHLIY